MSYSADQERKNKKTRSSLCKVEKEYGLDANSKGKNGNDPNVDEFSKRLLETKEVTVSGGPFHNTIRTPTYGDPYDEIPWKVGMGLCDVKERHGYEDNPFVCKYRGPALMKNWVEERRDRQYIKYDRPRISQYAHYYQTDFMINFKRPVVCNKQKDVLLKIANFPIGSFPGHQPELSPDTIQLSAPALTENCILDEKMAKCEKALILQKRRYKAEP